MIPTDILRNINRLMQLLSKGFRSNVAMDASGHSANYARTNHPLPVQRNICPHCKLDIPAGAHVCHHCHQFVSVKFNLANIITIIASVAAVSMSVYSLYVTATQAQVEKNIQSRRFLIETLRNMQQIQDELQTSREKNGGEENLTEKEILMLNYYQVLSKTLAQYIKQDPNLFVKARCTYEPSVHMRQSPSTKSKQIATIYKDEEVFILGKFTYGKGEMWYYAASADQQKIGWIFKYLEIVQ
ncbi:MAG: SH3 domain-containing protein [Bacteroidota bacterium]